MVVVDILVRFTHLLGLAFVSHFQQLLVRENNLVNREQLTKGLPVDDLGRVFVQLSHELLQLALLPVCTLFQMNSFQVKVIRSQNAWGVGKGRLVWQICSFHLMNYLILLTV